MNRETFVTIFSALMAEADAELLREAEGLVFWRRRELRTARVQQFSPGQVIVYLTGNGKTQKIGTIDHLNRFSVTVKHQHATEGYTAEVVTIERVLRPYGQLASAELPPSFGKRGPDAPA